MILLKLARTEDLMCIRLPFDAAKQPGLGMSVAAVGGVLGYFLEWSSAPGMLRRLWQRCTEIGALNQRAGDSLKYDGCSRKLTPASAVADGTTVR